MAGRPALRMLQNNPSHPLVVLRYLDAEVELTVRDDGRGAAAGDGQGYGLAGMRERGPPDAGRPGRFPAAGAAGRYGYMAAIKPFRHLIVYPALMRQVERDWRANSPFGLGAAT